MKLKGVLIVAFMPFSLLAKQAYLNYVYDVNGIIFYVSVNDVAKIRTDLVLEMRGTGYYSWKYERTCWIGTKYVTIAEDDTQQALAERLSICDPTDYPLMDLNGDWTSLLPPFYPVGKVLARSGTPVAVVAVDETGDLRLVDLSVDSSEVDPLGRTVYSTAGASFNVFETPNGSKGVFYVVSSGDGLFSYEFRPTWSGGVSSPAQGANSLPSPTGPVFDTGPVSLSFPSPASGSAQLDNGSYLVAPTYQTITVNNGSGSDVSLTLPDYSPVLNAIGGVAQGGFDTLHQDFDTLNENEKLFFTLDSDSDLFVAQDSTPTFDGDSSVSSDVQDILDDVGGWDFSFGTGNNVIGNIITAMIGNPPTSFGSQDTIWDIDIPIFDRTTVHSTFRLSDWFPPAFRSFVLFCITLFFGIASAKAVSRAFS
ncbi:MAG: hypothetical protein IJ829_09005 [Kiritimatiellae bacterium]|nr:hypothetical protein [Kiritimatiellia bacterium]